MYMYVHVCNFFQCSMLPGCAPRPHIYIYTYTHIYTYTCMPGCDPSHMHIYILGGPPAICIDI